MATKGSKILSAKSSRVGKINQRPLVKKYILTDDNAKLKAITAKENITPKVSRIHEVLSKIPLTEQLDNLNIPNLNSIEIISDSDDGIAEQSKSSESPRKRFAIRTPQNKVHQHEETEFYIESPASVSSSAVNGNKKVFDFDLSNESIETPLQVFKSAAKNIVSENVKAVVSSRSTKVSKKISVDESPLEKKSKNHVMPKTSEKVTPKTSATVTAVNDLPSTSHLASPPNLDTSMPIRILAQSSIKTSAHTPINVPSGGKVSLTAAPTVTANNAPKLPPKINFVIPKAEFLKAKESNTPLLLSLPQVASGGTEAGKLSNLLMIFSPNNPQASILIPTTQAAAGDKIQSQPMQMKLPTGAQSLLFPPQQQKIIIQPNQNISTTCKQQVSINSPKSATMKETENQFSDLFDDSLNYSITLNTREKCGPNFCWYVSKNGKRDLCGFLYKDPLGFSKLETNNAKHCFRNLNMAIKQKHVEISDLTLDIIRLKERISKKAHSNDTSLRSRSSDFINDAEDLICKSEINSDEGESELYFTKKVVILKDNNLEPNRKNPKGRKSKMLTNRMRLKFSERSLSHTGGKISKPGSSLSCCVILKKDPRVEEEIKKYAAVNLIKKTKQTLLANEPEVSKYGMNTRKRKLDLEYMNILKKPRVEENKLVSSSHTNSYVSNSKLPTVSQGTQTESKKQVRMAFREYQKISKLSHNEIRFIFILNTVHSMEELVLNANKPLLMLDQYNYQVDLDTVDQYNVVFARDDGETVPINLIRNLELVHLVRCGIIRVVSRAVLCKYILERNKQDRSVKSKAAATKSLIRKNREPEIKSGSEAKTSNMETKKEEFASTLQLLRKPPISACNRASISEIDKKSSNLENNKKPSDSESTQKPRKNLINVRQDLMKSAANSKCGTPKIMKQEKGKSKQVASVISKDKGSVDLKNLDLKFTEIEKNLTQMFEKPKTPTPEEDKRSRRDIVSLLESDDETHSSNKSPSISIADHEKKADNSRVDKSVDEQQLELNSVSELNPATISDDKNSTSMLTEELFEINKASGSTSTSPNGDKNLTSILTEEPSEDDKVIGPIPKSTSEDKNSTSVITSEFLENDKLIGSISISTTEDKNSTSLITGEYPEVDSVFEPEPVNTSEDKNTTSVLIGELTETVQITESKSIGNNSNDSSKIDEPELVKELENVTKMEVDEDDSIDSVDSLAATDKTDSELGEINATKPNNLENSLSVEENGIADVVDTSAEAAKQQKGENVSSEITPEESAETENPIGLTNLSDDQDSGKQQISEERETLAQSLLLSDDSTDIENFIQINKPFSKTLERCDEGLEKPVIEENEQTVPIAEPVKTATEENMQSDVEMHEEDKPAEKTNIPEETKSDENADISSKLTSCSPNEVCIYDQFESETMEDHMSKSHERRDNDILNQLVNDTILKNDDSFEVSSEDTLLQDTSDLPSSSDTLLQGTGALPSSSDALLQDSGTLPRSSDTLLQDSGALPSSSLMFDETMPESKDDEKNFLQVEADSNVETSLMEDEMDSDMALHTGSISRSLPEDYLEK